MSLFGGVLTITGVSYLMLTLFAILALGYALGRITIKGISLGSAGVFIIALVYGAFFYTHLDAAMAEGAKTALKIVENIGLILFVSSVGFIAGPKFFSNMKRNFKSYVLIGLVIILSGGISCAVHTVWQDGRRRDRLRGLYRYRFRTSPARLPLPLRSLPQRQR